MTSEREIEALAEDVGERHHHDGETVFAFTPDELREFARRLQPARVPEPKDEVQAETEYELMRRVGWNECRAAMLSAAPAPAPAPAPEAVKASDTVSEWMQQYGCGCSPRFQTKEEIPRTCPQHMRGRLLPPLPIAHPAPPPAEPVKCERCGARNADEAATMCDPIVDTCPGVGLFDAEQPGDGGREGVDPIGDFLAYWESRGEGLFFHFGWDAVNLYNAAAKAKRLASAPQPGQQWSPPAIPEGTREAAMVVIERDQHGKPTIWCDPEIVDLVGALNTRNLRTVASCSGHGGPFGIICMADGRELLILPNWDSARVAERALGAAFDAQRGGEGE